jgi:hypothetical protein
MIARMWHGRVLTGKARDYREFLNQRAILDYQAVPGNLGVHIAQKKDLSNRLDRSARPQRLIRGIKGL